MKTFCGLVEKFKDKGLAGQLARGIGGGGLVRIISAVLALMTTAILARTLGPEGFGQYSFAFSVAMLLAVPTQAGLPILVLREVARYQAEDKWGLMRGLLQRANQLVASLSLVIFVVALGVVGVFESTRDYIVLYAASFSLIPLLALGNIRGAALQGLRHVLLGQMPENLFRPIVLLSCIAGLLFYGTQITPVNAMASHAAASLIAVVLGAWILRFKLPVQLAITDEEYNTKDWLRSLMPLSFLAGVQVINLQVGTIFLGLFNEDQDVGVYRATFQVAMVVVFGLSIVSGAAAPHMARLHAVGDKMRLQLMIRNTTRLTTLVAFPVMVVCFIYGEYILSVLYGDTFSEGYYVLLVLCLGQFVCAAFGPTSHIMNMTREEGETVRGVTLAAIINIGLSLALAQDYGALGVAIATASSAIVLNSYLALRVHSKLGMRCGPL